ARQEVNSTESLLCICAFDPENIWQLYDPNRDIWLTLPVLPSLVRNLAEFSVVSVSGKLFVLGGHSDAVDPSIGDQDGTFATNKVWAYDSVFRYWARRASMIVPRAMFACCVWNGKILVAGGFTSCRKSISKAEIYDPVTDTWDLITDLDHTHNSACTGLVIDGAVHVVHKGLTTVQVLENLKDKWRVCDLSWTHGPMTVVNGSLYAMSRWFIYKKERDMWKVVGAVLDGYMRIGHSMVGFRDDISIIGGVGAPEGWNLDIKKKWDVEVLLLGNKNMWQKVASMTRCQGSIIGYERANYTYLRTLMHSSDHRGYSYAKYANFIVTRGVLFIDTVHRYYSSVKEIYCSFIALMDENTVRLWLKDHQDASEKLVRQQAEAFQLQLDTLRTELQATRGDDPDRWIFAITEYFSLLNTPADQHLRIMEFNLEGAAAEWFRWMSRNGLITTWARFEESVKNRFRPSKYEDPRGGALSKLLQLGTVEDYQREFEKLMNRVTGIPDSLLISFYISDDDIK
ncbi:F-box/kelch-repeat protein SKIP30, partial [Tanacetum coccineum]